MTLQCMVVTRFACMGVVILGYTVVVGGHGSGVYIGMGDSACSSEGTRLLQLTISIHKWATCVQMKH